MSRIVEQRARDRLQRLHRILEQIRDHGPNISAKQIAERLDRRRNTITRDVAELVEMGRVIRGGPQQRPTLSLTPTAFQPFEDLTGKRGINLTQLSDRDHGRARQRVRVDDGRESVDAFLARGGRITRVAEARALGSLDHGLTVRNKTSALQTDGRVKR